MQPTENTALILRRRVTPTIERVAAINPNRNLYLCIDRLVDNRPAMNLNSGNIVGGMGQRREETIQSSSPGYLVEALHNALKYASNLKKKKNLFYCLNVETYSLKTML